MADFAQLPVHGRCGNTHLPHDCPHKDVTCKRCRKQGHFVRFYKTKLGKGHTKHLTSTKPAACVGKVVTENTINHDDDDDCLDIYTAKPLAKSSNGKPCIMQIDTAADHREMCKSVYRRDSLTVCGELLCEFVYNEQKRTSPLIVVDLPERPTLLGISCSNVFHIKHEEPGSPNAKQD